MKGMKVININKEQLLVCLYVVIIVFGVVYNYPSKSVQTASITNAKKTIVIDAGHGGFDPGKIGYDDLFEKDINLSIAKKLEQYFTQAGYTVIMTRTEDKATAHTKNEDMENRVKVVNSSKADLLISIHQNSFTDPKVYGSQVFYYENSQKSESLAKNIQDEINLEIKTERPRKSALNDSYYILKQTNIPAVIVECGFLSNPEENEKLSSDEYQDKMAWSIYMGTTNYFKNDEGL